LLFNKGKLLQGFGSRRFLAVNTFSSIRNCNVTALHAQSGSTPRLASYKGNHVSLVPLIRGLATQGTKQQPEEGSQEEESTGTEEKLNLSPVNIALALLGVGMVGGCLYYLGLELIPSKLGPNSVRDRAHAVLQKHAEVESRYGTPLNAYGEGASEGRRNHIENRAYKDEKDRSNRLRVKFNIKGPSGRHGIVWAEASDKMKDGEWVYLLVQDARNGSWIVVQDNRIALAQQSEKNVTSSGKSAPDSTEAMNRLRYGSNR